jgi:hypothetical protein
VLARLSLPAYAASFDSTMQTSPQPKHLKTCNSVNDEIFGLMRISVIGISQTKHDAEPLSSIEGRSVQTFSGEADRAI